MEGITEKSDEFLSKKLNESRSFFDSSLEDYFGEKFLKNFEWEKGNPLEYRVRTGPCRAFIFLEDGKTYVHLDNNSNNFKKENIVEKEKTLFYSLPEINEILTGQGVFNIFHELTHCWFKYKGYHDKFKKINTGYNLMEGFCEFCAYDIIKSNEKIKKVFPESVVFAEEEMNKYSAVLNYVKYFPFSRDFLQDELNPVFEDYGDTLDNYAECKSEESYLINPFDKYGDFIKDHMKSRSIALFNFRDKYSRIKVLNSPPETKEEVMYLSNNPF
jgi:hypothetical protein